MALFHEEKEYKLRSSRRLINYAINKHFKSEHQIVYFINNCFLNIKE